MLDGGIDKLVDQKADAYRGNPQALQQSYAKNQELMDLLAMQKLKAEKDAAARDMAMKAEQMPGTIAEQMEQEMLGRTKDDLVAQTSGILDQKQKKAAQTAQALGQPAPGAKPPQGAGIASMAPPQGMPQFEEGGEVDDAKGPSSMEKAKARITVADVKEKIQNGSLKRAQFDGLVKALPSGANKDEIVGYLQESHSYEPTTEALTGPMDSDMPPMDLAGSEGFESIAAPEEEDPLDAFSTPYKRFTAEEMEQTGAGGGTGQYMEMPKLGDTSLSGVGQAKEGLTGLTTVPSPEKTRRQKEREAMAAKLRKPGEAIKAVGRGIADFATVTDEEEAEAKRANQIFQMRQSGLTQQQIDAALGVSEGGSTETVTDDDTGVMDGMTTGAPVGTGTVLAPQAGPQVTKEEEEKKSAEQLLMEELGGMGTDATELQSTQDAINAVSPTRFSDSMPRAMGADGKPIEGLDALTQSATKLAATDPVAMRAAEEERLEGKLNRGITGQVGPDGKPLTRVQEMLKQGTDYQAMIDRQTSGDALKQRKRDALMGGLSKGGFRGGAQAGRNMRRNVMNEERATFMMKRGLDLAAINKDFDIIKAAGEGGQSAYESAVADRRDGLNLVAEIGKNNLDAVDAKITQIYANADNAIKNRLANITTQLDASLKSQQIRQANSKQLDEIAKQLDTVRGKIAEEVGKIAAVEQMTPLEIQAMITDRELAAGIDVRQKELDLRLKQLFPSLRALAVEEVASDNARKESETRKKLAAEVAARTK